MESGESITEEIGVEEREEVFVSGGFRFRWYNRHVNQPPL